MPARKRNKTLSDDDRDEDCRMAYSEAPAVNVAATATGA